jgi:hypothetical protein
LHVGFFSSFFLPATFFLLSCNIQFFFIDRPQGWFRPLCAQQKKKEKIKTKNKKMNRTDRTLVSSKLTDQEEFLLWLARFATANAEFTPEKKAALEGLALSTYALLFKGKSNNELTVTTPSIPWVPTQPTEKTEKNHGKKSEKTDKHEKHPKSHHNHHSTKNTTNDPMPFIPVAGTNGKAKPESDTHGKRVECEPPHPPKPEKKPCQSSESVSGAVSGSSHAKANAFSAVSAGEAGVGIHDGITGEDYGSVAEFHKKRDFNFGYDVHFNKAASGSTVAGWFADCFHLNRLTDICSCFSTKDKHASIKKRAHLHHSADHQVHHTS